MASYNRVIMIGNLTKDPEYNKISSGQAVCRFSLASNRQFKNKATGAMVQEVCFVDVDVWGTQAEHCNKYLQKGRAALVEGRLKFDSWQDNEGARRSKHSIVADRVTFLSANMQQQASGEEGLGMESSELSAMTSAPKASNKKPESSSSGELDFKDEAPFDEDLPF